MTIKEVENLAHHLRWIKDIIDRYEYLLTVMEKEKDCFQLYGITYAARREPQYYDLNSNFPIPLTYIKDGLEEALQNAKKDLQSTVEKLKGCNIEIE